MKTKLKAAWGVVLVAGLLNGCAADGSLQPGVGEALLGAGLIAVGTAGAIAAARQPTYYCWYDRWGREWCRYD